MNPVVLPDSIQQDVSLFTCSMLVSSGNTRSETAVVDSLQRAALVSKPSPGQAKPSLKVAPTTRELSGPQRESLDFCKLPQT